jgi:hypothetical protein
MGRDMIRVVLLAKKNKRLTLLLEIGNPVHITQYNHSSQSIYKHPNQVIDRRPVLEKGQG